MVPSVNSILFLIFGEIKESPQFVAKYSIKLELFTNIIGLLCGDIAKSLYKSLICKVTSTSVGSPSTERLSRTLEIIILSTIPRFIVNCPSINAFTKNGDPYEFALASLGSPKASKCIIGTKISI